jgi:hypothetical protein
MKKLIIACLLLMSFLGLLFFSPVSLVNTQDAGKTKDKTQADNQEETEEQTKALNVAINAIVDRVEKNIRSKEPGWKLKTKAIYTVRSQVPPGTRGARLEWKSKKGFVEVGIELYSSDEEAHRLFHFQLEAIARGVFKELSNLGDEAALVTSGVQVDPSAGVYFRKNNILVDVDASNKDLALLCAPYVAEQLE